MILMRRIEKWSFFFSGLFWPFFRVLPVEDTSHIFHIAKRGRGPKSAITCTTNWPLIMLQGQAYRHQLSFEKPLERVFIRTSDTQIAAKSCCCSSNSFEKAGHKIQGVPKSSGPFFVPLLNHFWSVFGPFLDLLWTIFWPLKETLFIISY